MSSQRFSLILIPVVGAGLVLLSPALSAQEDASAVVLASAWAPDPWLTPLPDSPQPSIPDRGLRPGQVLVLASWSCSFLRLDRVNELGRKIVEAPLSRAVEEGSLLGWGQFNGEFRDEFNYHTYYLATSVEQYRTALGRVLNHISREAQGEMEEFYTLCHQTREMAVRVVTAHP